MSVLSGILAQNIEVSLKTGLAAHIFLLKYLSIFNHFSYFYLYHYKLLRVMFAIAGYVPVKRVKWCSKLEHEFINNYKILQGVFKKLGVEQVRFGQTPGAKEEQQRRSCCISGVHIPRLACFHNNSSADLARSHCKSQNYKING